MSRMCKTSVHISIDSNSIEMATTDDVQESTDSVMNDIAEASHGDSAPSSESRMIRMSTRRSMTSLGTTRTLNTRLLDAIEINDSEKVKRLLEKGASANTTCRMTHISACHLAAMSNADALQLLLQHGAITQRVDKMKRTPLILAAWAGAAKQIAMLLKFPEDLQLKVLEDLTPATIAEIKTLRSKLFGIANDPLPEPSVNHQFNYDDLQSSLEHHQIDEIRSTLRHTSSVPVFQNREDIEEEWKDSIEHNCRNFKTNLPRFDDGWTPLHAASYAGHHHCVKILLAWGSDPNQEDVFGRTALDLAGSTCYQGYEVSEDDFISTIKTLLNSGGKFNRGEGDKLFDSVLHTAVKMGSKRALPLLLEAGAPVDHLSHQGHTPLHDCVYARLKDHFQILASYNHPGQKCLSVDVRDEFGFTPLMTAVGTRWIPGVCVALHAGADVTLKDTKHGDTAIHIAAEAGDPDVLKEILSAAILNNALNLENMYGETPLSKAVISGQVDCVAYLLEEGASFEVTCLDKLINNKDATDNTKKGKDILHVATSAGQIQVLEYLLNHDEELEKLLFHEAPSLQNRIPLEYAVEKNDVDVFMYLLEKTFESSHKHLIPYDTNRLIDLVASFNRTEIYNYIRESNCNYIIHDAITKGHSLHKAILYNSRDMIVNLLKEGADLSQIDKNGQTAISLLMYHIPKPTEFLEEIFDSYIYSNEKNIYDPACEITINYSVLTPICSKPLESSKSSTDCQVKQLDKSYADESRLEQMNVLEALLDTGNRKEQRTLLAHPLVESFLYLKWKSLSNFIILIILIYSFFLISLNSYVVTVFYHKDKNITIADIPTFYSPNLWKYFVYIAVFVIVIQEIFLINLKKIRWLYQMDIWVKFSSLLLATAITKVITIESKTDDEWRRHTATFTVVLSWTNMLILLSWTPSWGYYMQMFWKVSYKIIKIILSFSFLMVCFAISFMIQFHTGEPFENPLSAMVKTVVMMTAEFDYQSFFEKFEERSPSDISKIMLRIIFLMFLIFIAIVLMNLMIGVAVNDLQSLKHKGNLRRLEKQVACLCMLESFINLKLFGTSSKRIKQIVIIKPIENKFYLFSGPMREIIINKAQNLLEMQEKEAEDIRIKTKLDDIQEKVAKRWKEHTEADEDEVDELKRIKNVVEVAVTKAIENAVTELKIEISVNNEKLIEVLEQIK